MSEEKEPKSLPLPWCRLYAQEFLTDEKFRRIAFQTGEHILLVRGFYIMLMCMAAKTRARDGKITISEGEPMSLPEILWYLNLETERAEAILVEMEKLKMIARPEGEPWEVINFADRNPPSDTKGGWYTKKWRDKKKEERAEPPAKDKEGKQSEVPSQENNTPVTRLAQIFSDTVGFWPPTDPSQFKTYWEDPILDWLLLADGDEDLVEDWIARAIQHQRKNNYVFTKPRSIDGAIRMIAGQVELKKLWREAKKLITEHGAHNEPELDGRLAEVIEAAGGWVLLCKSKESIAREKFAEAFDKVSHDKCTKEPG